MLRDFFLGFIKIHILYHASKEPVYGLWLIEELGRHGYKLSPGTLYPLLSRLTKDKLLSVRALPSSLGPPRRYYRLSAAGRGAFQEFRHEWSTFRDAVDQLIHEEDNDG